MQQNTIQKSKETIDARRYEAFERFEANQAFEEKTDIAERLGYAIDITIGYYMKNGKAYCITDTQDRPFSNQTLLAKQRGEAAFSGAQAFEATRLSHEHDEAIMIDKFGAGLLAGNVLMKLSRVPDAVVAGATDIKGYRRDLLRSFVRLYWREKTEVYCRLFTLDQNHLAGLQAVGRVLEIDTTQSSEDTLADYSLVTVPDSPQAFVFGLVESIKEGYDQAILASSGTITHAGSIWSEQNDALLTIDSQPHLFREHMQAIKAIRQLGLTATTTDDLLEAERQRTAAAIKLASCGEMIESSSDGAVTAEVAAGDYGRECATAAENGMNQTQTAENTWREGHCQVCFKKTKVGSCMVCKACETADNKGIDLLKLRSENLKKLEKQQRAVKSVSPENRRGIIHASSKESKKPQTAIHPVFQQNGKYFKNEEKISIGGMIQQTKQISYHEWLAERN